MIRKRTSGFTLLETLLTVAVLTSLFLVIFEILQDYVDRTLAQSTAKYMNSVSESITSFIKNPLIFEQIYEEADAQANNILRITTADILTGTFGTVNLDNSAALNININDRTPLKTGIEIMLRAVAPASVGGSRAIEVIIATDERVDDNRVRTAAEFSELNGGFYQNPANGIESSYNGWTIATAVLAGTPWATTIATAPPSLANGSYLVHYKHIAFEKVAGDYLYRVNIPGQPELNRLFTDLNMGGQNIVGTDDINPTGDINFNGRILVNGSLNILGDAVLNDGNFNAYNTLQTNSAIIRNIGTGTSGQFNVQGGLNANFVDLDSDLDANSATFNSGFNTNGILDTNELSAATIDSQNTFTDFFGGATASDRIDITTPQNFSGGQIATQRLSVGGTSPIALLELRANQDANITTINARRLFMDSTFQTNSFGECENGC